MKIKQLNEAERPREKLLLKGAKYLTSTELLAIVLGTGYGELNALDLAKYLMLFANQSLINLYQLSPEKLCQVKGIGKSKAISIIAALELGKRLYGEVPKIKKKSIQNAEMVNDIMLPKLKGLQHEECWILYLNRSLYLIGEEMLSSGSSFCTIIDIKTIVKKALEKNTSSVILIHNHPSGNPNPGKEDIEVTRLLRKALNLFEITLADHLIITDNSFYSFSDDRVSLSI